jgi:2',3'-cyclic-nucleotide 2'-phosphodiesterase (5'-nucleotidase family)
VRPLALALLIALPARAEWLAVYDTTDRHGHLEAKEGVGGAGLLGGWLAVARRSGPSLLVDSGDLFQGTMVSNLAEGQPVVRAMNALGYAASAVGNHEFDFGPVGAHATAHAGEDPLGALRARAAEAAFPLLSANISAEIKLPWKRWHIVTVGGVKVGLVGGTSEDLFRTTIKPNLVGLRVEPLGPAVSSAAAEARRAGAQIVVAMVHAGGSCPHLNQPLSSENPGTTAGCEDDSELFRLARTLQARARGGEGGKVDALFGGHTHKALIAVVDGLPVAQPLAAVGVAEIDLEIIGGKPTGRYRVLPNLVLRAGPKLVPDEKIAATFAADVTRAAEKRAAPVGVTLPDGMPRAFARESPLGNLVADLVRQAGHAQLALVNGGGLRADLPLGPLTYGALFEALPFDNKLATVEIEGGALRRMLQRNLESDRGILSISGARVSARCQKGGLAVELTLDDGKPLEDARRYRVATSDFLALGGDDFGQLSPAPAPQIDDELLLRDLVARELALLAQGGILYANDPRFWNPAHRRIELPMPRPVRCHD